MSRTAENAVRKAAVWAPLVAAFLLAASFAHAREGACARARNGASTPNRLEVMNRVN
jgi:hypothetical protein